jgi:hypothetical protein
MLLADVVDFRFQDCYLNSSLEPKPWLYKEVAVHDEKAGKLCIVLDWQPSVLLEEFWNIDVRFETRVEIVNHEPSCNFNKV